MTCLKRFAEVKLISDTHMQNRIHIGTHTKPHTPVSVMEETTELYDTQPYTAKKKEKKQHEHCQSHLTHCFRVAGPRSDWSVSESSSYQLQSSLF